MFFSTKGKTRTKARQRSRQSDAVTILNLINEIFDKFLENQRMRLNQQYPHQQIGQQHQQYQQPNVIMAAYRYMKLKPNCGKKAIKTRYREMVKSIRPDLEYTDPVEKKLKENQFLALQNARQILDQLEADDE